MTWSPEAPGRRLHVHVVRWRADKPLHSRYINETAADNRWERRTTPKKAPFFSQLAPLARAWLPEQAVEL